MNDTMKITLAVLALLAVGGVWYWSGRTSPQAEEENFSSYSNDAYGISFKYPNRYFLSEREAGNGERRHYFIVLIEDTPQNRDIIEGKLIGTESPPWISVDIFQNNLDNMSVSTFVTATNNSNWKLGDGNIASTTVGGQEAVAYSWDGLYRGDSVVFAHRENIIMLSGTYFGEEDQIRKDFEAVTSSFLAL